MKILGLEKKIHPWFVACITRGMLYTLQYLRKKSSLVCCLHYERYALHSTMLPALQEACSTLYNATCIMRGMLYTLQCCLHYERYALHSTMLPALREVCSTLYNAACITRGMLYTLQCCLHYERYALHSTMLPTL